jgi:NitT/TauT family transport system ATP-binding protein
VVVLSHRPAVVKSIHRLTQLQGVPPLQRRDHPAFAGYFKSIWKELEVHEG